MSHALDHPANRISHVSGRLHFHVVPRGNDDLLAVGGKLCAPSNMTVLPSRMALLSSAEVSQTMGRMRSAKASYSARMAFRSSSLSMPRALAIRTFSSITESY